MHVDHTETDRSARLRVPVCTELTAFERGRLAFRRGDGIDECPFDDASLAAEWLRGWGVGRDRVSASRTWSGQE